MPSFNASAVKLNAAMNHPPISQVPGSLLRRAPPLPGASNLWRDYHLHQVNSAALGISRGSAGALVSRVAGLSHHGRRSS